MDKDFPHKDARSVEPQQSGMEKRVGNLINQKIEVGREAGFDPKGLSGPSKYTDDKWLESAHEMIVDHDKKVIIIKRPNKEHTKQGPLSESEKTPESPRQTHSDALLATVPKDGGYIEHARKLEELSHGFRQQVAASLEPALNTHVQAMPHETYEEKKEVAKWVNEELRRFDLAIKCPKTGQPSILLVGSGNHPEIGRFILEHRTSESKRVRTVQTPQLPHLELMEANPRREAIIEWREKVGRQSDGASRA